MLHVIIDKYIIIPSENIFKIIQNICVILDIKCQVLEIIPIPPCLHNNNIKHTSFF
jgi:hypothetical protein